MRRRPRAACGALRFSGACLPPLQSHALQSFYVHGQGPAILEPQKQGMNGAIMSKRNPNALKEYKVMVSVYGTASRTVLAASQDEAERVVEKMLFQPDKQTPQSKMLCAFEWDIPRFNVYGRYKDDPTLMIEMD